MPSFHYTIGLMFVGALLSGCGPAMQRSGSQGTRPEFQRCERITEPQVASLFDRWNTSLSTLDPEKVTANYRTDALLLPTVSNRPRANHDQIRDYFKEFLKKEPSGKIEQRFIRIGCNVAIDGGVYTFTFKDGEQVTGRYTYVYEYEKGKWLIASHHSSAMPQDISTEPWAGPNVE